MKGKAPIISLIAIIVSMISGLMPLAGWHLHNDLLRSFVPGEAGMKYNEALSLVLAALVLLVDRARGANKSRHPIAFILPGIVLLTALLTLYEYATGYSLGMDALFMKDQGLSGIRSGTGRMSPLAAINLVLIGAGLFLLHKKKAATFHVVYISMIIFTSFFMLIGISFIPDIPAFIRLSIPAAIGFIALSVALWFAQPMLQQSFDFKRKMLAGFIAMMMLMLLISLFSYYYSDQRIKTSRMVSHTNEVLREAEQTLSLVKDIESGGRAYIITADSAYLTYFSIARDRVFEHINRLKLLTGDNPVQQARVDSLHKLVGKRLNFSMQYIQLRNEKGFEAARNLMATPQGKNYTAAIRDITSAIQNSEYDLLRKRREKSEVSIALFNRAFFVLMTAVLLLLAITFFSFRRNITRRENKEESLLQFNRQLEQKINERTEEIKRSEKRYRYLFENNPLPMWVIDLATFRFLDVNEMAVQQYGYSRQEFLSMTAVDIRPEADREAFLQSDHSLKTGTTNYNRGIWTHRKKDGTTIEVEITGHDIMYEGLPARFIMANDITERKKAEERLIASERQFRYTLDHMLEGVQIIDFNWRYIYVNDSFCRHGKYPKEEMLGHTVMEKYPGIEHTGIFKVYQQCFRERVSIHLENHFVFPDGSMGWFELSFQPVPEGIFILSIDITERKKTEESIRLAEANYREIFEKAGDAIHVMDSDTGVVLEANQKACEITGYTKEVLIHGNRRDMLSGDPQYSLEAVNGFLQKAAAGEPQLFEWLIKKKDGSLSWIEVDLKKATIAGKERLLSFYREINERKKVQREIQELNGALEQKVSGRTAELEKANSELEAFSYSVSHDLRAPLRGIAGFSAMLENKYGSQLDGEGKRITAVIRKNTIRMGELIDDLLAFSRLGRQPISKSTIASQAMVQEIVNELDTNGKPVQWQIGHLPECWGDLKTIRQVWVNLISNAVKYSRETPEPIIEIGTYMENKEQIFFVRDNGVGFDDKYKHKLFKVFQRLHSVAEFEGTGVGLAIVEKIISRHGGRVWATAEKGKGASFCFTLPECSA